MLYFNLLIKEDDPKYVSLFSLSSFRTSVENVLTHVYAQILKLFTKLKGFTNFQEPL